MKPSNPIARIRTFLTKRGIGSVGLMMVLTVIAGLIQNPLDTLVTQAASDPEMGSRWALWSGPIARYPDDIAALILIACALFRIRATKLWHSVGIGAWMLAMVLGATHSLIFALEPVSNIVDLFRQVAFPAMLIFAGLTLTAGERKLLTWTTLIVAGLNSVYALLEALGIRLFDPVILANQIGRGINDRTGLPGNFMGWAPDGSRVERIGGIFMSPPIAGIFMAFASVLAFWAISNRILRYSSSLIFAVVTLGTLGRAGLVLLAAGIIIPLAIRWVGRIAAIAIALVAGTAGFVYIASHGNSLSHVRGIVKGAEDGLLNPLGRGFGFIGNLAEDWRAHESLLGIGLSAGGWLAIACLLVLIVIFVVDLWRTRGRVWESALALGIIACAMLSESAGTLAGSVPIWLFVGATLAATPYHFRPNPTQQSRSRPTFAIP